MFRSFTRPLSSFAYPFVLRVFHNLLNRNSAKFLGRRVVLSSFNHLFVARYILAPELRSFLFLESSVKRFFIFAVKFKFSGKLLLNVLALSVFCPAGEFSINLC